MDAQNFGLRRAAVRNTSRSERIQAAMPATAWQVRSSLAVTVVATSDVVPRRATVWVTAASASGVPSITSRPPAPWMCTSTKPGDDREAARLPPGCARWYRNLIPRTHGDNLLAVNYDHGIGDFLARSKRTADKNGLLRGHGRHHRNGRLPRRASRAARKENGQGAYALPVDGTRVRARLDCVDDLVAGPCCRG